MTEIRNYDNVAEVAQAAAENAVEILQRAVETTGHAVWVLAGGTSPMSAYKKIVLDFADAVDWSLVTVLMGDERMVFLDDKDSNWGTIIPIFESNEHTSLVKQLVPHIHKSPELTAEDYQQQIHDAGITTFDLVWIGVGEDGHTLSLFPENDAFKVPTDSLVVAVHDSPKPPSDRISLSLRAAEHISELVIFATGENKRDILRQARLKGGVPVAVFAEVAEAHGAEVRWLYDAAAWEE